MRYTLNFLALTLITLTITSCSGSEEESSSEENKETIEIPCPEKMEPIDFKGFLGLHPNTLESDIEKIIPGKGSGSYSSDNKNFTYLFDDIEGISTYVTVDGSSGEIKNYFIFLSPYENSAKAMEDTRDRMIDRYQIDDCHDRFFLKNENEIKAIMGDDYYLDTPEAGKWMMYKRKSDITVHFFLDNQYGCNMIKIFY